MKYRRQNSAFNQNHFSIVNHKFLNKEIYHDLKCMFCPNKGPICYLHQLLLPPSHLYWGLMHSETYVNRAAVLPLVDSCPKEQLC